MKIINSTPFSTGRLREIAQRVADQELESGQRAGVTVHFTVSGSRRKEAYRARTFGFNIRQSGPRVSGLKYNQAIVLIRKQRALDSPASQAGVVALQLAHEFAEMLGLTHENMRGPRYSFVGNWEEFYRWAWELPLVLEPKKPPVDRRVLVERKLANARARLKQARTREKRAITLRKKWERRVAYFAKTLETNHAAQ